MSSLPALPAERLRLAARLFCQGSPLRSDKRKPGALDSADSQAPTAARRAFAFYAPLEAVPRRQKSKPKGVVRMQQISKSPLFPLGQVVATPGALAALEKAGQQPQDFLARHVHGDWGDLCDEDRNENRLSLEEGFRLLSSYRTCAGDTKVWVISEADRSVTTLLLPEEYSCTRK